MTIDSFNQREYVTYDEAIEREITAPIESGGTNSGMASEYDVKAIAEEIIEFDSDGGVFVVCEACADPEFFWSVVVRHARTEFTAHWKESGYANYCDDSGEQVSGFWLDIFGDPDDDPIDGMAVVLTGDMDPQDFTDAHQALTREALAASGFEPVNPISDTSEFSVRRTET